MRRKVYTSVEIRFAYTRESLIVSSIFVRFFCCYSFASRAVRTPSIRASESWKLSGSGRTAGRSRKSTRARRKRVAERWGGAGRGDFSFKQTFVFNHFTNQPFCLRINHHSSICFVNPGHESNKPFVVQPFHRSTILFTHQSLFINIFHEPWGHQPFHPSTFSPINHFINQPFHWLRPFHQSTFVIMNDLYQSTIHCRRRMLFFVYEGASLVRLTPFKEEKG